MISALARRLARLAAIAGTALTLAPGPTHANPLEGEARPITRDNDRVYTVVAGEGDGASTVTNPANLGFLDGINGVIDFSLMGQQRRRRGSGVGAFIGIPVPLRLIALGLGYQLGLPFQPEGPQSDDGEDLADPQGTDDLFHKVTFATSIPLGSWVRVFRPRAKSLARGLDRLSIGFGVSRSVSSGNFHAHGTNQFDLAVSYWPSRFLAMGLVGRAINMPRTGREEAEIQPVVIDPEIAIRPLGTPAFEVAVGARFAPAIPGALRRFRINEADPRGRIMTSFGGVRLFAEAEMMRFNPIVFEDNLAAARVAARVQAGVEINFANVGFAVAPLASINARNGSGFGVDGAAARLRISQDRYPAVASRPRVVAKLALARYDGDRGMMAVLDELDDAAERRGTVLLETRSMGFDFAQIEEIREAMLRVRNRRGTVIVYMNGGALRSYFLASAADRIIVHPHLGLEMTGMRTQTLYYGELLEKLGVVPEFVRVAEYKAWPEKAHRSTASAPVASQRHHLYADVWNHVLRMIARDRGEDVRVVREWIDDQPMSSPEALERGIVDELAFPDELDAKLEKWLGRRIRIETPQQSQQHRMAFGPPPRIAVLLIEGDLVRGDSFTIPIIDRTVAGDRTLTKEIERLRKDPSVRAVVVRVNSLGGDVGTADAIARELDLVRKVKPVVISMGNACASGGYYIATSGQYIYADATTFTGSIGVFFPKVDVSGALERLGITVDEEDFGRRAGMRSWLRPMDEDERAAAQADVEMVYGQFLSRVAKARSMTLAQADRVARGRVWSGVRAIEEGLVDDYGGVREAVLRARAIAGLEPDEGTVEIVPAARRPIENLRAMFGFDIPSPLGRTGASAFGSATPAMMALRSAVPLGMLTALKHLPVALWWGQEPNMMALAGETWIISD